eukprot:746069-Hanusia_phi.AAC.4
MKLTRMGGVGGVGRRMEGVVRILRLPENRIHFFSICCQVIFTCSTTLPLYTRDPGPLRLTGSLDGWHPMIGWGRGPGPRQLSPRRVPEWTETRLVIATGTIPPPPLLHPRSPPAPATKLSGRGLSAEDQGLTRLRRRGRRWSAIAHKDRGKWALQGQMLGQHKSGDAKQQCH